MGLFTNILCCLALSWAVVAGGYESAPLGMGPDVLQMLDDEPLCMNTHMDCAHRCGELVARQIALCSRPYNAEVMGAGFRAVMCLLVVALAVTALQLVRVTMQQQRERATFAAEKAELQKDFEGVKEQAFEFAKKLQALQPSAVPSKQAAAPPKQGHDAHNLDTKAAATAGAADTQGHSAAAALPPAPVSETSAPNLALLVAEAAPARDTTGGCSDQVIAVPSAPPVLDAGAADTKCADAKSPAAFSKPSHPQHRSPVGPGQARLVGQQLQQLQPQLGAGYRGPNPGLSSSGPSLSPGAPTMGLSQRASPGGPVLVPAAHAAGHSPAGPVAPMCAPYGRRPGAPAAWSPQQQQQQHAMSCPPAGSFGAVTSPSRMGAPGPTAPHSAGQMGGAVGPGMFAAPQQYSPGQDRGNMMGAPTPPAAVMGGWVNTSRGSGTPVPFGAMSPPGVQQQFGSQGGALSSPMMATGGLATPATASTTRSGGSLNRVQSVHSNAGSCGGPGAPNTPMSASSTASGTRGSSSVSGRSRQETARLNQELMMRIAVLAETSCKKSAEGLEKAKARLSEAQQQQQARTPSASPPMSAPPAPTSTSPGIRQSPV